jgi:hypothetical protein
MHLTWSLALMMLIKNLGVTHRSSTIEARFFFYFLVIFSGDESELYDGDIFLVMIQVV